MALNFVTDSDLQQAAVLAGSQAGQPHTFDHLPYVYEVNNVVYCVAASLATEKAVHIVMERSPEAVVAPYYMGHKASLQDILSAGGKRAAEMINQRS